MNRRKFIRTAAGLLVPASIASSRFAKASPFFFGQQGTSVAPNGLLNNISGYYKFDGASTVDAVDSSSNGNTLAHHGTTSSTTGLLNGARTTTSGTSYFSSNDSDFRFGDQDITIIGFTKPASVTGTQSIVSRYDTGSNQRSYNLRLSTTSFLFLANSTGVTNTTLTFTGLVAATATWYFYCIRYTASTDTLELSVTPVSETTFRAFQSTTHANGFFSGGVLVPLQYGADLASGSIANSYAGDHDECALYSAKLTDTQVGQYCNSGGAGLSPLGFPNFTT